MGNSIKNGSLFLLILFVIILTGVALLSVWGYLGPDVIRKSVSTIAVIIVAATIATAFGQALEHENRVM